MVSFCASSFSEIIAEALGVGKDIISPVQRSPYILIDTRERPSFGRFVPSSFECTKSWCRYTLITARIM